MHAPVLNQNSRRRIIVLANSKPWCAAIEQNFPKSELSWVLDLEGLAKECQTNQFCAAIIEIPAGKVDLWCVEASNLANNPFDLKLFAVGTDDLPIWQKLLTMAGFSSWFWSMLQIPILVRQVTRHQNNSLSSVPSLETSIESSLPWG